MSAKVKAIKAKYEALKGKKSVWLEYFQLIGEFVNQRKLEFTDVSVAGTFLNRELFDNTAARNNQIMASALVGSLWAGGAQTIKIIPAFGIDDNDENKEFYHFMLNTVIDVIDSPKAGMANAYNEYMTDQTSFGTSGIGVFKNEELETKRNTPIRFTAWNIKTMHIAENRWGVVDTIYNETEPTISEAVDEFGYDNLSAKSRRLFDANKGEVEKIRVLHAIEPRRDRSPTNFGNKNMPVASIHIELSGADKILKESGYESMPVKVVRFAKLLGEVYGRGSGGNGLPDAIELNVIWEAVTVASEKILDPPLGVLNDGDLTPVIDTGAGGLTVFNVTGRMGNQPPIFPLFTVGELKAVEPLVDKLTESLSNHFFLDRLLDLNNETRMTFGEAQIRNELRAASLGSVYTRQIMEGLVPIIDRVVEILFEMGLLGLMPDSLEAEKAIVDGKKVIIIPDQIADRIAEGLEFFKIKFISPAARAMNAEQVQGLLATMEYTKQAIQVEPEAKDVIDVDISIKRISELTGAPEEVVRTLPSMEKLREARDAAIAQKADLEMEREKSEIARNYAQAKSMVEKTGGGGGDLNEAKLGS